MRQVHNCKLLGGGLMSLRSISRRSKVARSIVWRPNVPRSNDCGQVSCFNCKTLYFRCILFLRFWNVEISLYLNLEFPPCSILVNVRPLMGKLNFRGYLISRFFPTREIRENLMHAKNTCFTVCLRKSVTLLFSLTLSTSNQFSEFLAFLYCTKFTAR